MKAFLGPQGLQNFHFAVAEACKSLLAAERNRSTHVADLSCPSRRTLDGARNLSIASSSSSLVDADDLAIVDEFENHWAEWANLSDLPPEQWQRYQDSEGTEWLCMLDSAGEVQDWFYSHSPGEWRCFKNHLGRRWWWQPAAPRWFFHPG